MQNKQVRKKSISIFIRSTIVWIVVLGVLPVYMLVGYTLFIVSAKTRHRVLKTWGNVFTFMAKHACGISYKISGLENIPKTPSLIASNHQSAWEAFAFATFLPQHVWILKRELTRLPVFGWALVTASPIAINRADRIGSTQQILKQSVQRMATGFWILIFPEGTRAKPGEIKPFKYGISRISQALKLPIIPITHNAGFCMPRGSYLMYPGQVDIIIDKPIYPTSYESSEELTKRVEDVITHNLATIVPPPVVS